MTLCAQNRNNKHDRWALSNNFPMEFHISANDANVKKRNNKQNTLQSLFRLKLLQNHQSLKTESNLTSEMVRGHMKGIKKNI